MIVSDVKRRVSRAVGDSNDIFFTTADYVDWVNDAQMEICRETDCLQGTQVYVANVFASGSGQALPSTFIKAMRVTYTDSANMVSPLRLIAKEELDNYALTASVGKGSIPQVYYVEAQSFYVWPAPTTSDTNTITHYYSKLAAEVDDLSDTLEVPLKYHGDVVRYVTSRAHARDQNYRAQSMEESKFNENVAKRRDEVKGDDGYFAVQEWSPFS